MNFRRLHFSLPTCEFFVKFIISICRFCVHIDSPNNWPILFNIFGGKNIQFFWWVFYGSFIVVAFAVLHELNRAQAHTLTRHRVVQLEFSWLPKVPNRLIFKFMHKMPAMCVRARRRESIRTDRSDNAAEDCGSSFPCTLNKNQRKTRKFEQICLCRMGHGFFFSSYILVQTSLVASERWVASINSRK